MMRSWSRGTPVRFQPNGGDVVPGQVWCDGPGDGTVWIALDDGRFVLAHTDDGRGTVYAPAGAPSNLCGQVLA